MKKVICFGVVEGEKRLFNKISDIYEIIAFSDNYEFNHGQCLFDK